MSIVHVAVQMHTESATLIETIDVPDPSPPNFPDTDAAEIPNGYYPLVLTTKAGKGERTFMLLVAVGEGVWPLSRRREGCTTHQR